MMNQPFKMPYSALMLDAAVPVYRSFTFSMQELLEHLHRSPVLSHRCRG